LAKNFENPLKAKKKTNYFFILNAKFAVYFPSRRHQLPAASPSTLTLAPPST
jgi:hypothetical protein